MRLDRLIRRPEKGRRILVRTVCMLMLAVLLAGTVTGTLFPVFAEAAQERFTETAENERFQVKIHVKEGSALTSFHIGIPLVVTITNRGADFDGVMKLMIPMGREEKRGLALGQRIDLARGESRDLNFQIPSASIGCQGSKYSVAARTDLLDTNGNLVFSGGCYLSGSMDRLSDSCSLYAGLITDRASEFARLTAFDMTDSRLQYGEAPASWEAPADGTLCALSVMDPEQAGTISGGGFHILILDAEISDENWPMLLAWVRQGGYLLASEEYLTGHLSDSRMQAGSGISCGYGKIFSFEAGKERTLRDYEDLCRSIAGNGGLDQLQRRTDHTVGYQSDMSLAGFDIIDRPPDVFRYLVILAVYILLAGPAMYYFLKRKDRLEYMLPALPVLALAGSLAVFAIGSRQRLTGLSAQAFSTVLLEEGNATEHTFLKVVSASGEKTSFSISPEYTAAVCDFSYGGGQMPLFYWSEVGLTEQDTADLMHKDYEIALVRSDEKQDAVLEKNRPFSEYGLSLDRQREGMGTIRCDLYSRRGKLYGTVTNETSCDLHSCVILRDRFLYMIGDLKAGETVPADGIEGLPDLPDTILPLEYVPDTSAWDGGNPAAAGQSMLAMLRSAIPVNGIAAAAVGFTDDYETGIDSSRFSRTGRMALLLTQTQIRQSSGSETEAELIWGKPFSDSDDSFYSSWDRVCFSESMELSYPAGDQALKGGLILLNPNEACEIYFYNGKSKIYEQVFVQTDEISGSQLEKYISSGQIRVQIQIRPEAEGYNGYMIPAFEVLGGEEDD